jgi:hypothetical protein
LLARMAFVCGFHINSAPPKMKMGRAFTARGRRCMRTCAALTVALVLCGVTSDTSAARNRSGGRHLSVERGTLLSSVLRPSSTESYGSGGAGSGAGAGSHDDSNGRTVRGGSALINQLGAARPQLVPANAQDPDSVTERWKRALMHTVSSNARTSEANDDDDDDDGNNALGHVLVGALADAQAAAIAEVVLPSTSQPASTQAPVGGRTSANSSNAANAAAAAAVAAAAEAAPSAGQAILPAGPPALLVRRPRPWSAPTTPASDQPTPHRATASTDAVASPESSVMDIVESLALAPWLPPSSKHNGSVRVRQNALGTSIGNAENQKAPHSPQVPRTSTPSPTLPPAPHLPPIPVMTSPARLSALVANFIDMAWLNTVFTTLLGFTVLLGLCGGIVCLCGCTAAALAGRRADGTTATTAVAAAADPFSTPVTVLQRERPRSAQSFWWSPLSASGRSRALTGGAAESSLQGADFVRRNRAAGGAGVWPLAARSHNVSGPTTVVVAAAAGIEKPTRPLRSPAFSSRGRRGFRVVVGGGGGGRGGNGSGTAHTDGGRAAQTAQTPYLSNTPGGTIRTTSAIGIV